MAIGRSGGVCLPADGHAGGGGGVGEGGERWRGDPRSQTCLRSVIDYWLVG